MNQVGKSISFDFRPHKGRKAILSAYSLMVVDIRDVPVIHSNPHVNFQSSTELDERRAYIFNYRTAV